MRDKLIAKIRQHPGIPAHIKEELVQSLATQRKQKPAAAWADILSTVRRDRRAISVNMHNRSEALYLIYAEYVLLLKKVEERIEIAQTHGTPTDAEREAALVNARRAEEGKRPLGTNGHRWQSWVPPHIKEAFAAKVSQAYDSAGYKRGNRFIPFVTTEARRNAKTVAKNLTVTLTRIREHHESAPGSGRGNTQYRALYLCAARMAERCLHKIIKDYEAGIANPVDNPLPVNWLALLDAPMRARLREAQASPGSVDPEGLGQFYDPVPANLAPDFAENDVEHAHTHPLEDDDDKEA